MQLNRDTISKFPGKKANSRTNFPNQPQTYVIAFALKATYDDLVTAQQMICNKRSPQPSMNSLTPTNSLKLLDSTQTVKLDQIPDTAESNDNVAEESKAPEEINPATVESNSSRSNIEDDQNKVICFIETDATSDSSNDEKTDNVGKSGETSDKKADEKSDEKSDEPKIIFNAINYAQRCKGSKFIKRKSKIHKSIAPKYNKFKCKTLKNSINNRLEKYYQKVNQNSTKSDQLRDRFTNISTVVPRARVLKISLAKENLLDDDAETMSSEPNGKQLNENDNGSQCSYPSTTTNDSFISNSSGKTLTYVASRTSSKNEDLNTVGTVKSAIEISPDSSPLYKSDVTVAVAYKHSKSMTSSVKVTNNEKFMHLASLTSNLEPISMEMSQLTSEGVSEFGSIDRLNPLTSREKFAHENKMSNVTLVNKRSNFDISSDDLFDMARTSSDFNEKTSEASTLRKGMEYQSSNERKEFQDNKNTNKTQQSMLETVINLGYYPEVTPSTSSAVAVTVMDQKDTFIIDNKNFHVCSKNMGDHRKETKINSNIFTKQCNERDKSPTKEPVLPNQEEIKEMLTDDKQPMKNTEEHKNTFNFSEMWDKLILMLDVAFKRLETTITDKIVKELKNSIASIELYTQSIGEVDVDVEKRDIIVIEPSKHEVISTHDIKETETGQQCNLVRSEAIDKIKLTLSSQVPKKIEPGSSLNSLKKLKSKLIRDYLEVLKLPLVVGPGTLEDKGDTVTISTVRTETFDRVHRMRVALYCPVRFVRENLFVITSVPAFFVVLVFVYGIILLIIQP